jgi:hypothetical protein
VTTEVVRSQVRRISQGRRVWVLRYWLCRDSTSGGGRCYFLRAHLQAWHDGVLWGEELDVSGGCGADPLAALRLFETVVVGAVFPSHLQDVVRDLTLPGTAAAFCPPRVPLRRPSAARWR